MQPSSIDGNRRSRRGLRLPLIVAGLVIGSLALAGCPIVDKPATTAGANTTVGGVSQEEYAEHMQKLQWEEQHRGGNGAPNGEVLGGN